METQSVQLTTMPACLEDVKIKSLPATAFYISDFVNEEEELALLNKVCTNLAIVGIIVLTCQDRDSSKASVEAPLEKTSPDLALRSDKKYPS